MLVSIYLYSLWRVPILYIRIIMRLRIDNYIVSHLLRVFYLSYVRCALHMVICCYRPIMLISEYEDYIRQIPDLPLKCV